MTPLVASTKLQGMAVQNMALISTLKGIPRARLQRVAKAVETQVNRDFAPFWKKRCKIHVMDRLAPPPKSWWPITIKARASKSTGDGYHDVKEGRPFAFVFYSRSWPLTLSHEVLEMLGNPLAKNTVKGPWPPPHHPNRIVRYDMEMCDPVEDSRYGYSIKGIKVSDFVTPAYFGLKSKEPKRFSFRRTLHAAHTLSRKGFQGFTDAEGQAWTAELWGTRKVNINPSRQARLRRPHH